MKKILLLSVAMMMLLGSASAADIVAIRFNSEVKAPILSPIISIEGFEGSAALQARVGDIIQYVTRNKVKGAYVIRTFEAFIEKIRDPEQQVDPPAVSLWFKDNRTSPAVWRHIEWVRYTTGDPLTGIFPGWQY